MDPTQERNTTLSALEAATIQLEQSLNVRLIPPEGISFGYALRGARDAGGIAAVHGGIKSGTGEQAPAGPCTFGTGEPVVRVILTTIKFDPAMRSAAILQFSDRALRFFENDRFLECAPLDTTTGNKGLSTMDWGIAACCDDGVPDVIYTKNASIQESHIILIGEKPADVANNIIICSNRI